MRLGEVELQLYRNGGYNSPNTNERTIELPLGFHFISMFEDALELGAVMPYYTSEVKHEVWDLHDPHPCCKKVDLESPGIELEGRNVLSISTVEHVGFNDYSKKHGRYPMARWSQGFKIVERIIKDAAKYMITFPIGYNPLLDMMVEGRFDDRIVVKRVDKENNWQFDPLSSMKYLYGPPQGDLLLKMLNGDVKDGQISAKFNNANAVCILTNVEVYR